MLKDKLISENDYISIFREFKDIYSQVEGVISIEEDNFIGDTFIVCIDSKVYKENTIPSSYKGIFTYIVDVLKIKEEYSTLISKIQQEYPHTSEHRDSTYDFFKKHVDLFETMLDKYNKK